MARFYRNVKQENFRGRINPRSPHTAGSAATFSGVPPTTHNENAGNSGDKKRSVDGVAKTYTYITHTRLVGQSAAAASLTIVETAILPVIGHDYTSYNIENKQATVTSTIEVQQCTARRMHER